VSTVTENIGAPTAGLLHPVHLLQLVAGALTGSVKRVAPEPIGGEPTSHYKVNLSLDNADRELKLSEKDRDARRAVFTALAVKGDVLPAEVWVDGQGRLRRLQMRLTQRPARAATLFFVARLEITAIGGTVASPPTRREYVRVDTPFEVVRSLRQSATT
jgi:hypothetical protein